MHDLVNSTGYAADGWMADTLEFTRSSDSVCLCGTTACIEDWIMRNFEDSVLVLLFLLGLQVPHETGRYHSVYHSDEVLTYTGFQIILAAIGWTIFGAWPALK